MSRHALKALQQLVIDQVGCPFLGDCFIVESEDVALGVGRGLDVPRVDLLFFRNCGLCGGGFSEGEGGDGGGFAQFLGSGLGHCEGIE